MMRRQLPVYSPITLPGISRATLAAIGISSDVRARLVEQLRREFAAEQVVLYGSGTQGLRAAIATALRRLGTDTVALPAFTCFDVAAAAVGAAARIALYDVDPVTLAPDPESFRSVLERGVRLAVVTPLYGYPVDWDVLAAEAARSGTVLIEDAAQGQGGAWRGRPLGSLGAISVLSWGRGKGWTGGSGGAVLWRGEWAGVVDPPDAAPALGEIAVAIRLLVTWAVGRPGLYALPAAMPWLELGETVYHDAPEPGALTRAAAAALMAHQAASVFGAEERRANATQFLQDLRAARGIGFIQELPGAAPGFLRLPVRYPGGMQGLPHPREALRLGIAASYPSTLASLSPVGARLAGPGRWPGGEELARTLVTLPTHRLVGTAERRSIVSLVSR